MPHIPFISGLGTVDTGVLFGRLAKRHPRLGIFPADVAATRGHIASHPAARALMGQLESHAGRLMADGPCPDASHGGARHILDRLYTLAFLGQLTGASAPTRAAVEQLLAVADFAAWPKEGLGLGEMLHAGAFGYDVLHVHLSPGEREHVADAIIDKGLAAAREQLACLPWWHRDACNWNIVCNGSIILAALAVGERAPHLAQQVFTAALSGLPNALATFAPDGGWPEGPGYWAFSMRYLAPLLLGLESALGTTLGIDDLPGIREAGFFRLSMEGPSGELFNFADSYAEAPLDATLYLWSSRYKAPALAAFNHRAALAGRPAGYFGGAARALAWFNPLGTEADLAGLPASARFLQHDIAAFRTGWTDPAAMYLACKGGDIQSPHAHADLGSFVLDAHGRRFVCDLGPDNYDLPGFWNGRPNTDLARWRLIRTGTVGHNTLLVSDAGRVGGESERPQGQHPLATAPIAEFVPSAGMSPGRCTIDLTAAYGDAGLTRAVREFVFDPEGRRVWIIDDLTPARRVAVTWQLHTTAAVALFDRGATLTLGGREVRVEVHAPAAVRLGVEELTAAPPAKEFHDTRRLRMETVIDGPAVLRVEIACG